MTMADECDVSKIVTAFLLNTCRLAPQISKREVQAAMTCIVVANEHRDKDEQVDMMPITTGSVAEFYIQPMLPHVSDIDVMYYLINGLAIPRGHPPHTVTSSVSQPCQLM